ncbi:MAG: hypothetical protein K5981_03315 [Clostridia bacterium]|nr:hypothetical protein [Clostridia bacterium]
MKIWLDDLRDTPAGYVRAYSVSDAKDLIEDCERRNIPIELIDLDYDLGAYEMYGGKGMRLLEWLDERGTHYPCEVHSTHYYGAPEMERFLRWNW